MNNTLHRAVLSFGSNTSDKKELLAEALEWASSLFSDLRCSSEYETQPLSGKGSSYMNAVGIGETPLSLESLQDITKRLEIRMGRDEAARKRGDVPLDIDVVCYDGEVLRQRDYDAKFFRQGYEELTGSASGSPEI